MSKFSWISERLWLDAVNSEVFDDGARTDAWSDGAALEAWAREAGKLYPEARALREFAGVEEEFLAQAKGLRAALRGACEAWRDRTISIARPVAEQETRSSELASTASLPLTGPSLAMTSAFAPNAVAAINEALWSCGVVVQLQWDQGAWHEGEVRSSDLSDLLWLLARSAARSWSRGDFERLRPCANPGCPLWFVDTSKNGTRRWCSMKSCGNRHKVAAHLARKQVQRQASTREAQSVSLKALD